VIVHIAGRELRQALITMIAREGITSPDIIIMFILIITMLLRINMSHGIDIHVLFVVFITMCLQGVGNEW